MLDQHILSEDLAIGTAPSHFYSHSDSNLKDRIYYRTIKMSENTAIVETYNINGIRTEPLSNKDFNVSNDGKSIINLEHFLQNKRAELFKIKRFSYRTFT